jgi:hypothetical protein
MKKKKKKKKNKKKKGFTLLGNCIIFYRHQPKACPVGARQRRGKGLLNMTLIINSK